MSARGGRAPISGPDTKPAPRTRISFDLDVGEGMDSTTPSPVKGEGVRRGVPVRGEKQSRATHLQ